MNSIMAIKRNKVCSILFRDTGGIYREFFVVEGDKPTDSSLYIIKNAHQNSEVPQTLEKLRELGLQHSYHARIGEDGLVQTWHKRNGKRFGSTRQVPFSQRKRPFLSFHGINDALSRYPYKIPDPKDVSITYNPEYFNDYEFTFYSSEKGLDDYLQNHALYKLGIWKLPTSYVENVFFCIATNLDGWKREEIKIVER